MINIAKVSFENSNRLYTYTITSDVEEIHLGQKAVVKTPRGYTFVDVKDIIQIESVYDLDLPAAIAENLKSIIMTEEDLKQIVEIYKILKEEPEKTSLFLEVLKEEFGEDFYPHFEELFEGTLKGE